MKLGYSVENWLLIHPDWTFIPANSTVNPRAVLLFHNCVWQELLVSATQKGRCFSRETSFLSRTLTLWTALKFAVIDSLSAQTHSRVCGNTTVNIYDRMQAVSWCDRSWRHNTTNNFSLYDVTSRFYLHASYMFSSTTPLGKFINKY